MTHIEQVKQERAENKAWLFQMMGLDDLSYGEYQLEYAFEYLKRELVNEEWIREITRSRMFWKWWRNQWEIRDKRFIQAVLKDMSEFNRDQMRIAYEEWHNPDYLHFFISQSAYTMMIDEVIKHDKEQCQKEKVSR